MVRIAGKNEHQSFNPHFERRRFTLVVVKRKKGDTDDKLIALFRKKTISSGILDDMRDKQRFEKKAEKRKKQKSEIKHRIEIDKKRAKRMA